jgi:hypothetical protein
METSRVEGRITSTMIRPTLLPEGDAIHHTRATLLVIHAVLVKSMAADTACRIRSERTIASYSSLLATSRGYNSGAYDSRAH